MESNHPSLKVTFGNTKVRTIKETSKPEAPEVITMHEQEEHVKAESDFAN